MFRSSMLNIFLYSCSDSQALFFSVSVTLFNLSAYRLLFLHSLLARSGSPKQPYPLISQPRWRFRFIPLRAVFMFSCPCSHACLVRILCIMHCTHTKVFIYHYHHCQGRVRVHSMAMKRRRVFPVSSSCSFVPHRWGGVSSCAVLMVL